MIDYQLLEKINFRDKSLDDGLYIVANIDDPPNSLIISFVEKRLQNLLDSLDEAILPMNIRHHPDFRTCDNCPHSKDPNAICKAIVPILALDSSLDELFSHNIVVAVYKEGDKFFITHTTAQNALTYVASLCTIEYCDYININYKHLFNGTTPLMLPHQIVNLLYVNLLKEHSGDQVEALATMKRMGKDIIEFIVTQKKRASLIYKTDALQNAFVNLATSITLAMYKIEAEL